MPLFIMKTLANLRWGHSRSGDRVGSTFLMPGESLKIEEGWVLYGPMHATVIKSGRHVKTIQRPLPKSVFDIDNPLEFPCVSCGAPRHTPCVGDNEACVYRVFHISGGLL